MNNAKQTIPIDKASNQVYTKYIRKELIDMITKLQKWGNSQGIRIPKSILESVNWNDDEKIELKIENDKIILEKVDNTKRKNIKELFENFNGKYEPIDIDWGKPEGDEIW